MPIGKNKMSWYQKLSYLRELSPHANVIMRPDGTLYVRDICIEIGGSGMLSSPTQAGRTPEAAVNECWQQCTKPQGHPLRLIKDAYKPTRSEYIWSNKRWLRID